MEGSSEMRFSDFVLTASPTEDCAGDVVRDCQADSTWPTGVGYETARTYLVGLGACQGALDGLEELHHRWRRGDSGDRGPATVIRGI